jgi:hypothetical protein
MEYAGKDIRKAFLYFMDIFKGELALVELAFEEYMVNDPVHQ